MTTTAYKIKERIKNLPDKVRVVMESGELNESLRALAKKYKIHFDKWEKLEDEIMLVLLSVKSPQELPAILTDTGLAPEDAQKLLQDLIEYIFKPMRKLLKETLEAESEIESNEQNYDPTANIEVDPRAPQYHGVKPDPKLGLDLDKPFNIGDIEENDDPYLEPIEI